MKIKQKHLQSAWCFAGNWYFEGKCLKTNILQVQPFWLTLYIKLFKKKTFLIRKFIHCLHLFSDLFLVSSAWVSHGCWCWTLFICHSSVKTILTKYDAFSTVFHFCCRHLKHVQMICDWSVAIVIGLLSSNFDLWLVTTQCFPSSPSSGMISCSLQRCCCSSSELMLTVEMLLMMWSWGTGHSSHHYHNLEAGTRVHPENQILSEKYQN